MRTTAYSFNDIHMTFSHPARGVFTLNGEGMGEVNITYLNDNTAHNLAADGSVMVSKIKAENAQITITMQQTSPFHRFLKDYFNTINFLPSNQWAAAAINLSSLVDAGDFIQATGVSPGKRPDQPYQQQGQMVTWTFFAANCQMQGGGLLAV
jgi:hypothetical protein